MLASMKRAVTAILAIAAVAATVTAAVLATSSATASPAKKPSLSGIHKIKHVIVIMQENRSFDSYFGTYPGAAAIPAGARAPAPKPKTCVAPFHDPNALNHGGPHGQQHAAADVDGGKMDGFIAQAEQAGQGCADTNNPACAGAGRI